MEAWMDECTQSRINQWMNKSDIDIIGISHFAQREKKLIIENNNIITDHDYISYDNNYTLFGNDRIHFNYKLNIPKNENTFIYSYFRSKPINRMINLSNLTRIKLGDWDEMFKLRIFRMIRTTFLIAIILFLFFNNTSTYFVTKDKNYLLF